MSPGPVLLCLCLSLSAPPRDRWLAEDKVKHFFASFVATSVSASAARAAGLNVESSVWVGAGVGSSLGIWKEIRDHRRGETASAKDLVWDAAGIGAASVVMRQVR